MSQNGIRDQSQPDAAVDDVGHGAPSREVAIVTGASRGFGRALVGALVDDGWHVVADARDGEALHQALAPLGAHVTPVVGDITDVAHRQQLVATAQRLGAITLIVNNAGGLGPSPLPALATVDLDALTSLFATNVVAPLGLVQEALPHLGPDAVIVDITSDAAVEAYEGWGVYGATKAALDHLGAVLAVERPEIRVLTVDPGDMNTQMHQDAFPGEDISDRPAPAASVPGVLALIHGSEPSGRYRAREVVPA
jgi:NAD(P)-dependent dehydrogenase (short-subunit alcohol dehydrogenase family)